MAMEDIFDGHVVFKLRLFCNNTLNFIKIFHFMIQFVLSCLLLLSIILWWVEAKYNFIHGIIMCLKKVCNWIKDQTTLKIDICKLLGFIVVLGVTGYLIFLLISYLYIPYFKSFIKVEDSAILLISKAENNSSLIGDWGTFGDFIGGTLNPILTFISICLILYTVYQNKKALDFNSEELNLSRIAHQKSASAQDELQKAARLQQVDNLFLNLITSLQYRQQEIDQLGSHLRDIYLKVFQDNPQLDIFERQKVILENAFIMRTILTIKSLLELIDKEVPNEKKFFYINVLKTQIKVELFQLLAVYGVDQRLISRSFLETYSFFDNLSSELFYQTGISETLNSVLIKEVIVRYYSKGCFGNLVWIDEYIEWK
ncbi:hypothetical protein [Acinetobacter faecalis]|uniref:hypothetical protein n=1 Tax=Acinetobacter faecalis TaxID=2665161 RepID=UPI002A91026A|nr:hypothetical protein [Acinetobacter faecalis]MDY6450311.1 hypothetical protein [Acinetobacter faecalis]